MPSFLLRKGGVYRFRWVLFPYRYNENIVHNGTTMTVQKAIAQMAAEYAANPPLKRYYDHSTNSHLISTLPAPDNFKLLGTLGYLSNARRNGTTALYSCKNGLYDTFMRTESIGCSAYPLARSEGYLYTTRGTDRITLYSCLTPVNHFASTRADCEGHKTEGTVGIHAETAVSGEAIALHFRPRRVSGRSTARITQPPRIAGTRCTSLSGPTGANHASWKISPSMAMA